MLSEGGCAEGPVPAARLARSGEMSQAAACILFWHSARAGPGKGLSQPLQVPGKGADLFGDQPCCLCMSCKDHPQAGISPGATHLPLPWPSTICKGVLPGQCQRYPLYWHHCFIQPQRGAEGQRDGVRGSFLPAGGWWGVTGRAQHPLPTDARHPQKHAPMVPLDTRQ